jgi:predicted amidohydrolase
VNRPSTLRLLACQISIPAMITRHQRDAHLALSAQKVSEALEISSVDLVVLPELSSIDYSRETFDNIDELSEPLDGPSYHCWRAVAQKHNCTISYSFARREGDKTYICIAVIDGNGVLIGHYDKIHLAQYGASMEKDYFTRGNHLFTFTVNGINLAPIICYDIRIPELSRVLTLDHKVDLILHCGAYFRDESFNTWHSFAITRAIENQVFFLSLNRAGKNYGHSVFCRPWMDENTEAEQFAVHDEEFRLIEIDLSERDLAREKYAFLKDKLGSYKLPVLKKVP